jgi:hypothetical protein
MIGIFFSVFPFLCANGGTEFLRSIIHVVIYNKFKIGKLELTLCDGVRGSNNLLAHVSPVEVLASGVII